MEQSRLSDYIRQMNDIVEQITASTDTTTTQALQAQLNALVQELVDIANEMP